MSKLRQGEIDGESLLAFAVVAAQLALLLVIALRFNLENTGFLNIFKLAYGGFVVHHLLPMRLRLPFFCLLSIAGLTWLLGMDAGAFAPVLGLSRTLAMILVGLTLIGICHLPIGFWWRALLLCAVTAGLALFAKGGISAGRLQPIIPLIGSLFMLRIIVYLYDVEHDKQPFNLWRSLAYFFLLPNPVFALFPVVDYKTFSRTHYDTPSFPIYQTGIVWMTRGIIQMLLGRVIYYQAFLSPSRVDSGEDLALYVFSNIGLYLKVSGSFHLIIGMLHLFGFNLPESNHRYFLATSFTDLWRRVNIYWKDFITKIFYYPAVVRLKAIGPIPSMVVATLWAFFVTWALHSYQTFWVRGSFPYKQQDIIFWGALGLLVVRDLVREEKHGRARALGVKQITTKERLLVLWKSVSTFLTLTFLWSFWSADSMEQWWGLLKYADATFWKWTLAAAVAIAVSALVLEVPPWPRKAEAAAKPGLSKLAAAKLKKTSFSLRPVLTQCLIPIALLFVLTAAKVSSRLGEDYDVLARSTFQTKPNKTDEENMVRSYYEDLMDVSSANPLLDQAQTARPVDWKLLDQTSALVELNDMRGKDLVPSRSTLVNGNDIKTNRWGMRDREYALERPANTVRIALLGSSLVMGWGVQNQEIFETLLEDRLNRELSPKTGFRYEILNFAVNGFDHASQMFVLQERVLRFAPDALILIAHPEDVYFIKHNFAKALRKHAKLPSDELLQIAAKAKIDAKTPELWGERNLKDHWPALMQWAYSNMVARCKEHGIRPYWIMIPGVLTESRTDEDQKMQRIATAAGFTTRALANPYGNGDRSHLVVGSWDAHPNAAGHKLIAKGLYQTVLSLDLPAPRDLKSPNSPTE